MLLLHPAPTCVDGCWCPVPLTFSNLRWWCFSFQQLAQTLYLCSWWLPSATCSGGLFPTTACAYGNLHSVVVVYMLYISGTVIAQLPLPFASRKDNQELGSTAWPQNADASLCAPSSSTSQLCVSLQPLLCHGHFRVRH